MVDTGAVQQLLSWTAPLVDLNNTVSLNYGAGLKLNESSQLVIDTSVVEPWCSPVMPLAITAAGGPSAKLRLNYGFGLKLDSNNYLSFDGSVLGLSNTGSGPWIVGWPSLP